MRKAGVHSTGLSSCEAPLHREHPRLSLVPTKKSIHPAALASDGVKKANENPLGSTSEVYANSPADEALLSPSAFHGVGGDIKVTGR